MEHLYTYNHQVTHQKIYLVSVILSWKMIILHIIGSLTHQTYTHYHKHHWLCDHWSCRYRLLYAKNVKRREGKRLRFPYLRFLSRASAEGRICVVSTISTHLKILVDHLKNPIILKYSTPPIRHPLNSTGAQHMDTTWPSKSKKDSPTPTPKILEITPPHPVQIRNPGMLVGRVVG